MQDKGTGQTFSTDLGPLPAWCASNTGIKGVGSRGFLARDSSLFCLIRFLSILLEIDWRRHCYSPRIRITANEDTGLLPSNPRGKQDHVLAQLEANWVKRCWTASSPAKAPQKGKIRKLDLSGMIDQLKCSMTWNKITKIWKYIIYLCIGADLLVWKILKTLVVLIFPYCNVLSVHFQEMISKKAVAVPPWHPAGWACFAPMQIARGIARSHGAQLPGRSEGKLIPLYHVSN